MDLQGDQIFHPPSGSNLPGSNVEANPFIFFPPDELRKLLDNTKDIEDLKKIKNALKQWERLYQYPTYPWRKTADYLKIIAYKLAEITGPSQNINYYQDMEVPDGYESILEPAVSPYDDDNNIKFKFFKAPQEGPVKDVDFFMGDFSAPKEPLFDAVKPRGDGPDPEGMEVPFPPTGGNIDGEPQGI